MAGQFSSKIVHTFELVFGIHGLRLVKRGIAVAYGSALDEFISVSAADFSRVFLYLSRCNEFGRGHAGAGFGRDAPREIGEAREVYILCLLVAKKG